MVCHNSATTLRFFQKTVLQSPCLKNASIYLFVPILKIIVYIIFYAQNKYINTFLGSCFFPSDLTSLTSVVGKNLKNFCWVFRRSAVEINVTSLKKEDKTTTTF